MRRDTAQVISPNSSNLRPALLPTSHAYRNQVATSFSASGNWRLVQFDGAGGVARTIKYSGHDHIVSLTHISEDLPSRIKGNIIASLIARVDDGHLSSPHVHKCNPAAENVLKSGNRKNGDSRCHALTVSG